MAIIALRFASAALGALQWYLVGWCALLVLKYLAVAVIWGSKIAAADRARKAEAATTPEQASS